MSDSQVPCDPGGRLYFEGQDVLESRADAVLVAEARSAREASAVAERESSPTRWLEAECYHELSRRGWGLRRIAEECGTNIDSVSVMVRMVSTYVDKESRPSFWTAYSGTRADTKAVHVSQNSGCFEWYTPAEYIGAARFVLGEIDLDPASSLIAQQTVKAKTFYTIEGDGLSKRGVCLVLSTDQRRREVARILAGAVLRLRSRAALPSAAEVPAPRILQENAANPLDVPAETRLSVHPG
jgi:hypothetical protein